MTISRFFDLYILQARLYPALLVLLPALLTVIAWFPGLLTSNLGATLVTLAAACGLLYLLSVLARTAGTRLEGQLLKEWGGWPTTLWLRHADNYLDAHTKVRYHRYLAKNVPGLSLPTAEDERSDPEAADAAYASAVNWLKEQRRDTKKYPLLFKENIEYGFRRNLLGAKPVGMSLSASALVGTVIGWWHQFASPHEPLTFDATAAVVAGLATAPNVAVIGASLISVIAIAVWMTRCNRRWVREAGDQYARALLATCDE